MEAAVLGLFVNWVASGYFVYFGKKRYRDFGIGIRACADLGEGLVDMARMKFRGATMSGALFGR